MLSNAGIYQFPFKINGLTQGKINQLKTSGRKLILNQQDQIDPQMGQFRIMNLRPSEIDSRENIVYLEMDGNHLEGILIPVVQINHGLDNIIKVYINGFDYTKPFNAYLINLNLSL